MKRLLCLAVAATLLALPVTAADAATAKKCAVSKKWNVVAKNSQVIVFTVARSGSSEEGITQTLYACNRKNAKRLRLADATEDELAVLTVEFSQVTLNGRIVAWQWTSTDISCKADCPPGYEPTTYAIERVNVATRKSLRWNDAHAEGTSLHVSAKGNAAWVQAGPTAGVNAVRVGNGSGHDAIDTGAIDPASLKLSGQTLSWVNGTEAKTATLS